MIANGALPGIGEVVQELAVGGDHGVGSGHAAQGGQTNGRQNADDGDDHQQLDEGEGAI